MLPLLSNNMKILLSILLYIIISIATINAQNSQKLKPNIIIILTDDQGYQDLGCYGSPDIKTPNIDALASNGIKLNTYYDASSVCTASRASLITGRIPARHGLGGVILPDSKGLSPKEITLPQLLKVNGYKTACYGKWHLGDNPETLPLARGFDEYFGIPYSNDMYIAAGLKISENAKFLEDYNLEKTISDQAFVANNKTNRKLIEIEHGLKDKVPLLEGNAIIEYPCNQATTTSRYFDRAINFISKSSSEPFFIYLTPNMPHIPLHPSEQFRGKSKRGTYGDVIEEIDWNVGRLISYLKDHHLEKNTLIIYSSDNGPWLAQKANGGTAKPFRDGKFSNFEGGVRVPAIISWKGKVPRNTISDQLVTSLDLFPTIVNLVQAKLPEGVVYDGLDISQFLIDPKTKIQREVHYYNTQTTIGGVRLGDWKYLPNGASWQLKPDGKPLLFNLKNDISEQNNLVDDVRYIEVLKKLKALINN